MGKIQPVYPFLSILRYTESQPTCLSKMARQTLEILLAPRDAQKQAFAAIPRYDWKMEAVSDLSDRHDPTLTYTYNHIQSHTIMILIMIILFTVWMTHDKWSWEVWSFLEIRWCPSRCCVSVLCWQGHNDPNWARSLNRIRWPGCSLQNMAVTRSQNTLWSQWAIAGGGSRVNPLVINRNTSTGFNWLIQGDCGPDVSSDRFVGAPWLLYNAWHVSFLVRPWICSRVRD